MKGKKIVLSLVLAVVLISGIVCIHQAFAWTVNVKNVSGVTVNKVNLYIRDPMGHSRLFDFRANIENNTTVIPFNFLAMTDMAYCPSYLDGKVGGIFITVMPCSGTESGSTTERCCDDLNLKIIKKSDGTYHFEKF